MSVYRILEFLQSMHLAHKLSLVNKFAACSHILDDEEHQHQHQCSMFLICNKCQSIKEVAIANAIFQGLQQNVVDAGFQFNNQQLEFNCVCDNCASAESADVIDA